MRPPDPAPSLWRHRAFNVFWAGQTLSAFGDAFALVATPLLVLRATGSLARMGTLAAAVAVASAVSNLLAGTVVDAVDRRRLMIACDLGRFAVWSAVAASWVLSGPSYPMLLAAACVGAVLGNTFQVSAITAVASLVPRDALLAANGRMQGAYAAMFFVGPALAGTVCALWGPEVALGVDAASFAVSALSLAALPAGLGRAEGPPRGPLGAEVLAGVRFVAGHATLRATTALLGLTCLLLAGRDTMLVFHLKQNLGQGDAAVGGVFAVAAAGAVAGAAAASPLRRRFGYGRCWLGAGALLGAAMVALALVDGVAAIAGFGALIGFAETLRAVNTMTYRQEVTPGALLGRVTSAFWALLALPSALGAAATTALGERVGVRWTIGVLGVATVALMAAGTRTALAADDAEASRALRREPT